MNNQRSNFKIKPAPTFVGGIRELLAAALFVFGLVYLQSLWGG